MHGQCPFWQKLPDKMYFKKIKRKFHTFTYEMNELDERKQCFLLNWHTNVTYTRSFCFWLWIWIKAHREQICRKTIQKSTNFSQKVTIIVSYVSKFRLQKYVTIIEYK